MLPAPVASPILAVMAKKLKEGKCPSIYPFIDKCTDQQKEVTRPVLAFDVG